VLACAPLADGGYALQELTEQGDAVGPRRLARHDELSWFSAGDRWLWACTVDDYPALIAAGVHVPRCHDIAVVERILLGRDGVFGDPTWPGAVVARAQGRPVPAGPVAVGTDEMPALFDLPGAAGPPDPVVDPIELLRDAYLDQRRRAGSDRALALLLAAECGSALAAAEMGAVGLPWRPDIHLAVLDELLGPRPPAGVRPRTLAALAAEIDAAFGFPVNPDSAVDLRGAFRRVGFDIDSTRSWVLKGIDHPAVAPLLQYKELSRLHTANGWSWLDQWVTGGRFHAEYLSGAVVSGRWATRGGGALQIPRVLRQAVVAEPGYRLVVADAAQLEPRVLAAISEDVALQRISADVDLYAGLAADGFGGDRATAKVAMLGAMYGQTGGAAVPALAVLQARFPTAWEYVERAARAGENGLLVRSWLGRTCPPAGDGRMSGEQARARGRFTRNFVVQATAAEWALTLLAGVRSRLAGTGARLVFFQHDEVVVHAPAAEAPEAADAVREAAEAAGRLLFGASPVRFPLDLSLVRCYADAA
jgi:DNA polymerase-1